MIAKFKRNRNPKRRTDFFFPALLAFFFIIIVGLLFVSNLKIGQRRVHINSRINALKEEIQALEEQKEFLEAKISKTSEEAYVEKQARESFNLKKPGEKVVAFSETAAEEGGAEKSNQTFWQKIYQPFISLKEKLKF